ncbi:nucleotide exchange factor GrpE [Actinomycetospora termitidis]|uniref:Nucleotide exchange factor GrpE n=1 Tax=Actinomycetospora termitidis TaxID=3053470 RepID=A0ABT7ME53_9PSEU|nr:nucleotide exchange factor GrpE [Actinomycetospora sp. Odt1-22]MDL5158944.1 nucleotide exchange factor GrpE [Actinomycetospora sp. Odt1-22]
MLSTLLYALAGLCLAAAVILWWTGRPERVERPGTAPGPGSAPIPAPAPPRWTPPPPPPARAVGPTPGPAPAPAPVAAPPPVLVPDRRAAEERRRLVELCIDLSDRLADENAALAGRLHQGLAEVGVRVVEPDGSVFDRREHDALDVEPAPSPQQVRTVASTARAGFVDRGEVLRRPGVVVYTSEEPS